MQLEQLRDSLNAVNEGLFYGEIDFSYDVMGFSMIFTHPSEILGDMCGELDYTIEHETADMDELNLMLSGIKELRYSYDLVELGEAIEILTEYIEENK